MNSKADLRPIGSTYTVDDVDSDGKHWRRTYKITDHAHGRSSDRWLEVTQLVSSTLLAQSAPSERK